MITKVGCAAMGIHAADQLAAGSAQLLGSVRKPKKYDFL
ncbi:hypothetical protein DENIT_11599 [Pseudomonas veronii]|nr:hypothetical protein DENIT_11599 [Pseudomonas veronii]